MNSALLNAARQFTAAESAPSISALGNGLINDTYLVQTRTQTQSFVLQRLNATVFPEPQHVLRNLNQLGKHIAQKPPESVRLTIPRIIPSLEGSLYWRDPLGDTWRALELISPGESRERIQNNQEAEQVGFALAHFHRLCSDISPELMHDTLPGFHITPDYYRQFLHLLDKPLTVPKDDDFLFCKKYIESHYSRIAILELAKNSGQLQERIIHGDPKLNNFLFMPGCEQVISLIDLDTVKPGLVHYDIGDCLRSCCHDKQSNQFDFSLCQIILQRYLQEAGHFFNSGDWDYLFPAIWLIPFELGLRFFNDYLSGNKYFKVRDGQHNLRRALAQFALCESINQQREALLEFIRLLKQQHPHLSAKTQ